MLAVLFASKVKETAASLRVVGSEDINLCLKYCAKGAVPQRLVAGLTGVEGR